MSDSTHRVWNEWNALPDEHPQPVKAIAARLGLSTAEVAAIVYPPERYGVWSDDQEPDPVPVIHVGTVWVHPTEPVIGITGEDGAVMLHFVDAGHLLHFAEQVARG